MNEFAWGTIASVATVLVGATVQFAVNRRTSRSTDRHINFEEANEIIARLSDEIARKDKRITELETRVHAWHERCQDCDLRPENKDRKP